MYNLIRTKSPAYLSKEAPTFFISATVAELFYKFGSFTFELIAFFITWYALSMFVSLFLDKKNDISHPTN